MHPPHSRPSAIGLARRKGGTSPHRFVPRRPESRGRSKLGSLPATWLVLFFFSFSLAGAARAASSLENWRDEIGRIRKLAENEVPRAHTEALTLQSALPVDATPVDRARML